MSKSISKTLIIGLGGTGQKVIREVKKRLFRRYGEIPRLVRFYAIDTDDNAYDKQWFEYYYGGKNHKVLGYNIQDNEYRQISRPDLDLVKADPQCANLNTDKLSDYYKLLGDKGANGFRVVGRAHVLTRSAEIVADLNRILADLRNANLTSNEVSEKGYVLDKQNEGNISVFVVASLSGGTGSSSFLDMPQILQLAGLDSRHDTNFGIFFMPRFFEGFPETNNKYINAYVALSELDSYIDNNDDINRLHNKYGDQEADFQKCPGLYTNVFLVDKLSKRAVSREIGEAAGYVASFVTAAISADSEKLQSNFSNSQHCMHEVRGKKQHYSGLGYCEIRFDRQNLVKYLLNRQLNKTLCEYRDYNGDNVNDIVNEFINKNHLDEGWEGLSEGEEDTRSVKNDLIDSIYKLTDDNFNKIIMGTPATGKDAAMKIVNNRDNYMVQIKAEADKALKEFEFKEKTILNNLHEFLDKYQSGMGFANFPDIAKYLTTSIKRMKEGLEKEIEVHNKSISAIEAELKPLEVFIKNNYGNGLFGIFGSKSDAQKSRINAYKSKVQGVGGNTLASATLEQIRKTRAVKVYEGMLAIIESYYKENIEKSGKEEWLRISGSSIKVKGVFEAIKNLIACDDYNYNPSKAAKNEVIFADAYFKDYFKTHEAFNYTSALNKELTDKLAKIFETQPTVNEALLNELRQFILNQLPTGSLIKKIESETMSFDELFLHCFGEGGDIDNPKDFDKYPHLKLLDQITTLFDPLWQWNQFADEGSMPPTMSCIVGVNDVENNILDIKHGYRPYVKGSDRFEYVGMGDPDRMVFFLQESAIPACRISYENIMKDSYERLKDRIYAFTDKRLENIEMLSPEPVNVKADIAWAYGWMHGLIANYNKRIQVKVSKLFEHNHTNVVTSGDYYDCFNKQRNSDIAVCYKEFKRQNDLIDDIYNQVINTIQRDVIAEMLLIEKWINNDGMFDVTVRGKKRESMSLEERKAISNEVFYLEKLFPSLNKSGVTISLNPETGKISFNDSIGILEARRNEEGEK